MKVRILGSGTVALALALAGGVLAAAPLTADQVRTTCAADFEKYCPDARPGAGAIRACIKAHFMGFTKPCRHALMTFRDHSQPLSGAADASR